MQSTSARSGIARSVIFRRSGLRIVAPTRGRGIRAMESWDGINYAERIAADDICISECFGWSASCNSHCQFSAALLSLRSRKRVLTRI